MKILTLNLRHDADRLEQRLPLIVEELGRLDPDVIAFQEVALPIRQAHMLAEQAGQTTGRVYEVIVDAKSEPAPKEGIAILSALDVIEHERCDLPGGSRVAQRVKVNCDGAPVNVVNTHLHHRPIGRESTRVKQVGHLLGWLDVQADPSTATVLLGDMNATPSSSTIALLKQRFASAYAEKHGREPRATFPTPLVGVPLPARTLDYILYSPGRFSVIDARLVFTEPSPEDTTLFPSDHFGVFSVLRLI